MVSIALLLYMLIFHVIKNISTFSLNTYAYIDNIPLREKLFIQLFEMLLTKIVGARYS